MFRVVLICLALLTACNKKEPETMAEAPKAMKLDHATTVNNVTLIDPYAWMRDAKWPDVVNDDRILMHLQEENNYTASFFEPMAKQEEKLVNEFKSRLKLADQSAPVKIDDYFYYTKTEENSDYVIYCRRHMTLDNPEEIILDVNKLAKGKEYTNVGSLMPSHDHRYIAYTLDISGDERYMLRILDLSTGQYLNDQLSDVASEIVWHSNSKGIFYTPNNAELRTDKVMYHTMGEAQDQDKLIYKENNPVYYVNISQSNSKKFLFIDAHTYNNNEFHIVNLSGEDMTPQVVRHRRDNVEYSIEHNGEYIYMRSNDTGDNFHISRSLLESLEDDHWNEYIPMDQQKYLASFDVTLDYMILNYYNQALPSIKILHLSEGKAKVVNFPEEAFTAEGFSTNYAANDLRVKYSSFLKPEITFNYDFERSKLLVLNAKEVKGGFDANAYEVKHLWAENEGVKIPISLFYKKSAMKANGTNPLYLYGYGSYGVAVPAKFSNFAISLVNRGFVYAIAHIRGGSELGQTWHDKGKLLAKKNTFEDFIACAEYLIKEKYTSSGNIAAMGGSAGGMLMGAVTNMRPELFKAVVAHVPFVDVLNTMLDDHLPLTPIEYKEWGNPNDAEYFEYIRSYSPYDNVKKQNYPHMFVTASANDIRVGYWEAAKWVAKIRDSKTDNNYLLLKTDLKAGHSGASARFETMREKAEEYMFIFKVFNVDL